MLKNKNLILLIPLLWMIGCAAPQPVPSKKSLAVGSTKTIRTTAYTHTEKGGRKNALGTRLASNEVKSASADWSRYPVGTKFQIVTTGEVYKVDDYGSALIGTETIDLYKPSRITMSRWGVRTVDIKILEWGSPEKSIALLQPRSQNHYVREMISSLQKL